MRFVRNILSINKFLGKKSVFGGRFLNNFFMGGDSVLRERKKKTFFFRAGVGFEKSRA